jgi:hypothetical protein
MGAEPWENHRPMGSDRHLRGRVALFVIVASLGGTGCNLFEPVACTLALVPGIEVTIVDADTGESIVSPGRHSQ